MFLWKHVDIETSLEHLNVINTLFYVLKRYVIKIRGKRYGIIYDSRRRI